MSNAFPFNRQRLAQLRSREGAAFSARSEQSQALREQALCWVSCLASNSTSLALP